MPLAVDGVKESTDSDLMIMLSGPMAKMTAEFGTFALKESPSTTVRQPVFRTSTNTTHLVHRHFPFPIPMYRIQ